MVSVVFIVFPWLPQGCPTDMRTTWAHCSGTTWTSWRGWPASTRCHVSSSASTIMSQPSAPTCYRSTKTASSASLGQMLSFRLTMVPVSATATNQMKALTTASHQRATLVTASHQRATLVTASHKRALLVIASHQRAALVTVFHQRAALVTASHQRAAIAIEPAPALNQRAVPACES